MHMSDALLNPVVGGAFWAASGTLLALSARKVKTEADSFKTPLMAITGAFVFAAQMINFTIPGTGSSGHLGGGLLLAALLGPWRAFITLASVLTIQCLFFADGGLLALGCNIFNLAFFPVFVAYPFIFKPLAGDMKSPVRLALASFGGATAGLLLGAFSVVLETLLSGITELPFSTFILFMMPIHLAIGLVEGLVVFGVLSFVQKAQPSLLSAAAGQRVGRNVMVPFLIGTLLVGGMVSWFASSHPDGLEWSMAKVSGKEELDSKPGFITSRLAFIQQKLAFLPDYSFKAEENGTEPGESNSPISVGTSVSGLAGSLMVLALTFGIGYIIRRKTKTHGHT